MFKKGDKVTLSDDMCGYTIPGDVLTVTKADEDFTHFTTAQGKSCFHDTSMFELIKGDSMNVGDILVDNNGVTRKVLAYLNQGIELYGLSSWGSDESQLDYIGWLTKAGIEDMGLKLKTDTTVEKSISDLEKELKMQPGTLRIKKED